MEQIAKATRGVTTLHGSGFLPSSADPFAPILTSLAQHGQDVSLAARVIQPGASDPGALDKEIGKRPGGSRQRMPRPVMQKIAEAKSAPLVTSLNQAGASRAGPKMDNRIYRAASRPSSRRIARRRQAGSISSPPPAARRERLKGSYSCRGRPSPSLLMRGLATRAISVRLNLRCQTPSCFARAGAFSFAINGR